MANDSRHIHLPDSDAAIIVMLGAVVSMTFALGLVVQVSAAPCYYYLKQLPTAQLYNTKPIFLSEDEEAYGYNPKGAPSHRMADLEEAPRPSLHRASATRYGSITQHVVDADGIRKMVLIIEERPGRVSAADAVRDDYAAWYEAWRQRGH
ncbi:hypothetical protein ASPVEDRAFT_834531 [Aspergillus versicolor CBS 583.65]|uniref:Uncharacterized protein n=1 Tax=Aspergillus versicolor CBS 583.65 TaxID=1036611 RepID=A0A1L9PUQ2_ASPVE|nr:uncharacterized protein ASPVEDRAFT_834531 [Aspergillus versicolor CBS 583.65]OJJ05162.1 hypothetical protein ASPVEDRAFT_834531 [Aspergillus versicolor CBS 583.65]